MRSFLIISTFLSLVLISCHKQESGIKHEEYSVNDLLRNGGKWQISTYKVNEIDCTQFIIKRSVNEVPLSHVVFRLEKSSEDLQIINGAFIFYSKFKNEQISVIHASSVCGSSGTGCNDFVFLPENNSTTWKIESLNKEELKINCQLSKKYLLILHPEL